MHGWHCRPCTHISSHLGRSLPTNRLDRTKLSPKSRQDRSTTDLQPLVVDQSTVGYLLPAFASKLLGYKDVFQPHPASTGSHKDGVTLAKHLQTSEARTAAVAGVLQSLRSEGVITGWRDELYPVTNTFDADPAFLVERAAAVHFGIKAYGVHINGYVEGPNGLEMWIARRSKQKQTWPGKLDHIVAGGQPHGVNPMENVVKECGEEASIPADLARQAVPVGGVTFQALYPNGLKRDVLFAFDLQLPADFIPEPQDGEVESFERMPIEKVASLISDTEEIKENCNIIILDFLIRHGLISPDQPGYLQLLAGLRAGDCS
ncbi:hypothetical protein WJX73_007075 [Symbiochloris irregularis]|uniref:Nudix hydrolase domain-containing protein n=1 Tax=Symbiochloris irregularis TaxID=706552 RepID=A0AAW1PRG0_9CHLO